MNLKISILNYLKMLSAIYNILDKIAYFINDYYNLGIGKNKY